MKRDGKVVDFDIQKIRLAISKAFSSLNKEYDSSILDLLSLRVTAEFQPKISNHQIQVEEIQDSVEKVLSVSGYADVAKSYILYRRQRENFRTINNSASDYNNVINKYLYETNVELKNHSLSTYSVGGLILSNSAALTRNYWLTNAFDQQISKAHENGDIYIHDLDMLTADSAGWSLYQLIENGLGGIEKKISCRPAKHLFSICNQLVNFLGIMQNEWAGAQSISSFDTYLAPFIKVDDLDQKEVNKCIETFIYGVNMPSRWGTQSPFSSVVFDWTVPNDLKDQKAIVGGKKQSFTYGDCQDEMEMIQRAFFQVMANADVSGHGFPFPIPTVMIGEEFNWSSKSSHYLFESAAKYGTPYFMNCIHTNHHPEDVRNQEYNENHLYEKAGGYFGYGENSGSIGMVTINLPRIAFLASDEVDFFARLKKWLLLSIRCLDVKRQALDKFLMGGLYPYTHRYISNFDHYFGTIGIIGMNEACRYANWIQKDLSNPKSQKFAAHVLDFMKDSLLEAQKANHALYNLEATPGENVSTQLIEKDQEYYPDLATLQKKYYTNSTELPVDYTDDVFEALDVEEILQSKYTGGAAFHIYLKENIKDWKNCRNLVKQIVKAYPMTNFTISPTYSVCREHGYMAGTYTTCPECEHPVEVWARVAGYYQPIDEWNDGKKEEFDERTNYRI